MRGTAANMNENQKSQKDTARAEVSLWSIVGLLLRKIHWLIAAGLAFGIGVYLVLGSNLVRGHTKSCGCIKLNDLTGQHIGSLTVLGRSDKYATRGKRRVRLWECKCDCGAITYKATDTLMAGVESSCAECAQKHNAACAIKNAGFIDGTQLSKIQNMKPSAANTSGCRGVSFNKKTLRWEAQIKFRGKRTRLGSYKNFDDAVLVRKKAEQAIFGEFLDSLALESKKDE